VMTCSNEFRLRLLFDWYFKFNIYMIMQTDLFSFIHTINMRQIIRFLDLTNKVFEVETTCKEEAANLSKPNPVL